MSIKKKTPSFKWFLKMIIDWSIAMLFVDQKFVVHGS